jgi:hypothetical protein
MAEGEGSGEARTQRMVAPPVAGSSSVVMLPELRILPCSMQRIWTGDGMSDRNIRSLNAMLESTRGERKGGGGGGKVQIDDLAGHDQAFLVN